MAKKPEAKLDPRQPYREAMGELIAARWRAVWKAVPVALAGEDIEGVHDVRVASRRLRAAMDVATEVYPDKWFRRLHRTAKEITSALGEVRDRDVLLAFLAEEKTAAPADERPGLDGLIVRIEEERVVARAEMETFLQTLQTDGTADEVIRRFGPGAAPPEAD